MRTLLPLKPLGPTQDPHNFQSHHFHGQSGQLVRY